MKFEVNGFDVSKWQGDIDWDVFITKGDFFIIRAGSIDMSSGVCYSDTKLERNAKLAIPFGKPVGFYWYFRPKFNAITQADYFCNLIKDYKWRIFPSIDVEETNDKSANAITVGVNQFLSRVSNNLNTERMTYTSPGFWIFNTDWAHKDHLWVACWTTADTPSLPRDWSYHGKTALFWQWKVADNGYDYGVKSKGLDCNRFMGTRADFNAMFGVTTDPSPAPDELTDKEKLDRLWQAHPELHG